jgi:hypothetical protein
MTITITTCFKGRQTRRNRKTVEAAIALLNAEGWKLKSNRKVFEISRRIFFAKSIKGWLAGEFAYVQIKS